uniref:Uncharacterized protein n=1 Tax=Oryza brachyantha TaxID=4533 RepID=J3M2X5_ORYBR
MWTRNDTNLMAIDPRAKSEVKCWNRAASSYLICLHRTSLLHLTLPSSKSPYKLPRNSN